MTGKKRGIADSDNECIRRAVLLSHYRRWKELEREACAEQDRFTRAAEGTEGILKVCRPGTTSYDHYKVTLEGAQRLASNYARLAEIYVAKSKCYLDALKKLGVTID